MRNTHYIGRYVFTGKIASKTIGFPRPVFVHVIVWNECSIDSGVLSGVGNYRDGSMKLFGNDAMEMESYGKRNVT